MPLATKLWEAVDSRREAAQTGTLISRGFPIHGETWLYSLWIEIAAMFAA